MGIDDAGDVVVAWDDGHIPVDTTVGDVFVRRFDAGGEPRGSAQRVDTTDGDQGPASVAADADGDFVVAWESHNSTALPNGVYARLYTGAGAPRGEPFLVAAEDRFSTPAVGMEDDGNFVVVWKAGDVLGRRFSAAGEPRGDQFLVDTAPLDEWVDMTPAVAMDGDGDFVVTWGRYGYGYDQGFDGVFARRFGASGAARGDEFKVNTGDVTEETSPAVAMDDDGDFAIAWSRPSESDYDYGYDIYARRYGAAGAALGGEFQVSENVTDPDGSNEARDPSVGIGCPGRTSRARRGTGWSARPTGYRSASSRTSPTRRRASSIPGSSRARHTPIAFGRSAAR